MNLFKIINMAALGKPEKFRKMILWTIIEYLLKGAPFGITLVVILELLTPLQSDSNINMGIIAVCCLALLLVIILSYYASRKAYFASFGTGYEITAKGRKAVISHLKQLPMGFYNSRDPGDIGAYLVTDYSNIEQMVTHMVPQFFGAISMPVILIICLICYDWKLAVAAAAVIPLSCPFLYLSNKFVVKFGKIHKKYKIGAESRMLEYLQGIKVIKAFNLTGTRFTRLEQTFRKLKDASITLEAIPGATLSLASIILNSGIII